MRSRPLLLHVCTLLATTTPLVAQDSLARNSELIGQIQRVSATSLGAKGTLLSFGDWMAKLGGVPAEAVTWEVNDCGEGSNGRIAPTCVTARLAPATDAQIAVDLQVIDLLGRRTKPTLRGAVIQSSRQLYGFARLDSLFAAAQRIGKGVVPLDDEPRHRLLWEAGNVRIFDIVVEPRDTTQFHLHDAPILYIPISVAPFDYQVLGLPWRGQAAADTAQFRVDRVLTDTFYAWRPIAHRVTNIGDSTLRLVAITNSGRGSGPATSDWRLEIPGQLELTSSWYQVTRLELPGAIESEWSRSSRPVVIVQLDSGQVQVQREQPDRTESIGGKGGVQYIPAGQRYRVRNQGEVATTLVVVQVR